MNREFSASQSAIKSLRRDKDELESRLADMAAAASRASAGFEDELRALHSRVEAADRLLAQQRQVNERQAVEIQGLKQQLAGVKGSLERSEWALREERTARSQLAAQLEEMLEEYQSGSSASREADEAMRAQLQALKEDFQEVSHQA